MEQFTDEALVDEVRGGSRIAFDELMKRYERLVYRVGYSYTHDPEDAMDVTQDVFLKAYTKLDTYRGSGAFKPWLVRIAHRESLNRLRRRRTHPVFEDLKGDEMPRCPGVQESDLLESERRHRVAEALEHLNPKERFATITGCVSAKSPRY